MHISIIIFWAFLIGVAAVGFLFGYFFNSIFRDMERMDIATLENGIVDRDNRIKELEENYESLGQFAGSLGHVM